ncbi:MAG: hypothetical protein PHR35_06745 [Kiritimatiellae bacterium]|nr:hypothetical protein [Kiritimatiellia bacterium]
MKTAPRQRLLRGSGLALLAAAIASLGLLRLAAVQRRACVSRQRLLQSLTPEMDRLTRYQAIAEALRQFPQVASGDPALPPGCAAPDRRELKRATETDGWRGVQAELSWQRLAAGQALSVLTSVSTSRPPWRVARLRLEALDDQPGQVRLDVTLETAEAVGP